MENLRKPVSRWLSRCLSLLLQQERDIAPYSSIFRKRGLHLLRDHYYLPIPNDDDIGSVGRTQLVGVDMNDNGQLQWNRDVVLRYRDEIATFPMTEPDDSSGYHFINGNFMVGDAHAYYAIIRHLRPRRVIEIGAGNSTLIANEAIRRNTEESDSYSCHFTVIEPYRGHLVKSLPFVTELQECRLQDVDISYFDRLDANDILFIDSSHVLKSGGDVWMEYCEIIPRLRSQVYVHAHDISLPKPYPSVYYHAHLYWNEQYVLQALLTNSDRLEVIWAGSYLFDKYPDETVAAFSPEYDMMRDVYPLAEPTSFWFRTR